MRPVRVQQLSLLKLLLNFSILADVFKKIEITLITVILVVGTHVQGIIILNIGDLRFSTL